MVNDGGPAFPCIARWQSIGNPEVFKVIESAGGMSLRDHFASTCDQPGTIEVYQLRGCPPIGRPNGWSDEAWTNSSLNYRAAEYWNSLSLDEKYAAYAELRYRIADAMLKAREVPDA